MKRAIAKLRLVVHALATDFDTPARARLALGKVLTSFAAWSFAIGLAVYGFEAHGIVGVGVVALIRYLPGAAVAPIAGVLIDRASRRNVLVVSAAAMAIVLIGATVAAALGAPPAVVFIFPGLYAIASAGYAPAESAMSPMLAQTPQQLSAGNVNDSVMENSGSFLGAVGAGFLLTATSPAFLFGVCAGASVIVFLLLVGVPRDRRPAYLDRTGELADARREIAVGLRTLAAHPALRLAWTTTAALLLFEGFAEVIVVSLALHVLDLPEGNVGFLKATWELGAVAGGAGLVLLLDRGRLVVAIAGGSCLIGVAAVVPGLLPHPVAAYTGWFAIGIGFVFVEVAGKTLTQRLGDDETMGRLLTLLQAGKLAAMAVGSVCAIVLDEVLGTRGALIALALLDAPARLRSRRAGRRGPVPPAAPQLDLRAAADGDGGAAEPRPHPGRVRGRRRRDRAGGGRRPLLPDRVGPGGGLRTRSVPPQRGAGRVVRRDRAPPRRTADGDRADHRADPPAAAGARTVPRRGDRASAQQPGREHRGDRPLGRWARAERVGALAGPRPAP
jgi:MFS family permease